MTDVLEIIRGYQQWRSEQEAEIDPLGPEAYAHHLEIEKELRILRALGHSIVRDNATNAFLYNLVTGDEKALAEVEATYEA